VYVAHSLSALTQRTSRNKSDKLTTQVAPPTNLLLGDGAKDLLYLENYWASVEKYSRSVEGYVYEWQRNRLGDRGRWKPTHSTAVRAAN
jgi:hypothetical protein